MECFAHQNTAAVGVCKSCGKGVCRTCAVQVDRGLACSESCRPFAESLSKVQQASIRNIGLLSAQRAVQPLFAALSFGLGLVLAITGHRDIFTWFFLALGGGLGIAFLLFRQKRSGGR